MGDLSEHYNHRDFACRCPECKGEFRIHLGLVGILEMLAVHFKQRPKVVSAFFCEAYSEKLKRERPSFHTKGKAVNISLEGIPTNEIFKFAETIPGVNGLGFYPEENLIHLDTRPIEKKDAWIKEKGKYSPLSSEKRLQYGL